MENTVHKYLTYSEESLLSSSGYWTAKEISQQPHIWRESLNNVEKKRTELNEWLEPILKKNNLNIILTGAGTSAYIGESISPHLNKKCNRNFEAISTTDIVSNPESYLKKDTPTLIVSYGRSGNSPESVAAIKLANQLITNCYHLIITCNPTGDLANIAQDSSKYYSLTMPLGTLDQSFAMTSSFTSMLISTLCVFTKELHQLELACQWAERLLKNKLEIIKEHAKKPLKRVVFLGSGGLQGIAKEAALKVLELSAGEIMGYSESPLGFRHGPKSLVDSETEIIILASNNSYTKLYEQDLLDELHRDKQASSIIQLDQGYFGHDAELEDVWVGLPYILYCQVFAFFKSIHSGITPDNPCPSGEVNRVVQGVTIYPYIGQWGN